MSIPHSPSVERRRSVRISPKGSVVLFAGEHVEHGRIANISSGGLLALTSECTRAIVPGAEIEVELRLDAASSEWLRLTGRVVRLDGCSIALALESDSEPFVRLIEDSVSASGMHHRVRTVVLIDGNAERRGSVAEAFRDARCAVLEVSTPLEAIVRLGESRFEPELIAIADSLPSSSAEDLRAFVEREHPSAKLVTIGDDLLAPGSEQRLCSSSSRGDLIARILELLGR